VPTTLLRRCLTIPGYVIAWLLTLAVTPFLLPVLALRDIVLHRRFAMVRALLMLNLYLGCESTALAACAWVWLTGRHDRERYLERNLRLERWWAGTQFKWGTRLYGIRVVVEGEEALIPGPIHLFVRHVSVIDNLIPAEFAVIRQKMHMRWVLNQSLLRDPCIDVVGQRLQNVFVRGGATDSEGELRKMRAVAANLGPNEGTVIYPEGALFSPARRERILARLRDSGDPELLARAEAMPNVLPLRLGGALALIEGGPDVDLVFCAHSGLERATSRTDIALGSFVGTTLRVRFWRVPAASIPADREGRIALLLDEWAKVDAFAG
jgi:1-acyl-sn-glycerol-3-phosphate acyltransferase